MNNLLFNVQARIKAQAEYCERTGAPHFAPKSGICWSCKSNIYEKKEKTYNKGTEYEQTVESGISIEQASSKLVTGCPHCNRSYCD